jgi:hypothetical protein
MNEYAQNFLISYTFQNQTPDIHASRRIRLLGSR